MIDGGSEPGGLTSAAGEVVPRLTTRGGVDALDVFANLFGGCTGGCTLLCLLKY